MTAPQPKFKPMAMVEYSLGEGRVSAPVIPGQRVRLLVLDEGSPVGFLDFGDIAEVPGPDEIAELVHHTAGARAAVAVPSTFEPVTVIVPTRGRSEEIVRCVGSLLAQDYPDFDVLIVDNNDQPGEVQGLLAPLSGDSRLRIVHEPKRGVSPARNRGIDEARGDIIAATDDDVVVGPSWITELVAGLADPAVDCVTGLVIPNGFRTDAQELFEEFGGFSKGFEAARYDLKQNRVAHALYPFSPGIYGSGNNMAYRKAAVKAVGGYDSRLGPGSSVASGEDLDLFLKFLFSGRTIAYQPRAIVRHDHRDDLEQLNAQIRSYGRGLSAVIIKWALSNPSRAWDVIRRLPAGLKHYFDPRSAKNEGRTTNYPATLRRSELRGMAEGAFLFLYEAAAALRRR